MAAPFAWPEAKALVKIPRANKAQSAVIQLPILSVAPLLLNIGLLLLAWGFPPSGWMLTVLAHGSLRCSAAGNRRPTAVPQLLLPDANGPKWHFPQENSTLHDARKGYLIVESL